MSKQRHNQKVSKEFKGLSGRDIRYLKQSIKYGHLKGVDSGTSRGK